MTREEAIKHLGTYSSTLGSGQTSQEQHEEAKKVCKQFRYNNAKVVKA